MNYPWNYASPNFKTKSFYDRILSETILINFLKYMTLSITKVKGVYV
jgi:hypothetical protein